MLTGNFFTIISTRELVSDAGFPDTRSFLSEIRINPGHEIFRGHFPGNPVVPGVCQVQMIRETIEAVTGLAGTLLDADNIKFLSVIIPDESILLELECKLHGADPVLTGVTATLRSPDSIHLKFKGTLCLKPR